MGHPLLFPFYNFGEKITKKVPDGNLAKEIVLYFGHGNFYKLLPILLVALNIICIQCANYYSY
jgi:hypothetical protein